MNINSEFVLTDLLEGGSSCCVVTFANPYSYYILLDEGLDKKFDYIFADGISLVVLYNWFSKQPIKRYSFDFTSIAPEVFEHCVDRDLSIALVGGTSSEVNAAAGIIESKFPGIEIGVAASGFFSAEAEWIACFDRLKTSGIEVLICGMGTPRQEHFVLAARDHVPGLKVAFTCGGFISQIASREEYHSPLLSKLHLRWLQRAIRHSYVRKRLLTDYPRFFFRFLRARISGA
jgi:UDP-Gal:alpha-D-GlcNAc-diphosphoundecaprenol beta-1,4-galactosyltransferase